MEAEMEQLRHLLQLIALPVTGQVRLVADDCCRLELLARGLSAWRRGLRARPAVTLTTDQERILAQLDHHLAQVCLEPSSPLWRDLVMRQSEGWRQARCLARQALVHFGWLLEVPPLESAREFSAFVCAP